MLVSELIIASLQNIGVLSAGETPSVSAYAQALSILQNMLYSWTADEINVFAAEDEDVPTVINTASYTWGTAGDITTTRPNQIVKAFINDTGTPVIAHSVSVISKDEYKDIDAKTTAGRPKKLYYDPTYPLAILYLWPVPIAVENITITSHKILPLTASYAAITDTIAVPDMYLEALVYNLSIRLAPGYGKVASEAVVFVATNSYTRLANLNSKVQQSGEFTSSEISMLRTLLSKAPEQGEVR